MTDTRGIPDPVDDDPTPVKMIFALLCTVDTRCTCGASVANVDPIHVRVIVTNRDGKSHIHVVRCPKCPKP